MRLNIEVSGELEAALKAQAHDQGISANRIACRVLADALTPPAKRESAGSTLELPILHLGEMGELHRRDIYNDVR